MKICITLAYVILLTSSISFGQNMTYFGFEGALTYDKYEVYDPCETITSTRLITGSWGFSIGQQIHKNLVVESGLIWKYYNEGYETLHYEAPIGPSAGIADAYYAFQIPIRLISRINLNKEKLFLTTTVGYHIGINRDYGNDYVYNPDDFPQTASPYYDYVVGNDTVQNVLPVEDKHLRKTFGLIEAGLGLEYMIGNNLLIGLSTSYFVGLDNVFAHFMSTGITNGTSTCTSNNAVGISKGSYSNVRLSIKYMISNLWRKKENGL